MTEDEYAKLALAYLRACQEAPTRPLAWLVNYYRGRGRRFTRENLRDRVHRARERGFLTPGRPGSAGAQATKKLIDWHQQRKRTTRKGGR